MSDALLLETAVSGSSSTQSKLKYVCIHPLVWGLVKLRNAWENIQTGIKYLWFLVRMLEGPSRNLTDEQKILSHVN